MDLRVISVLMIFGLFPSTLSKEALVSRPPYRGIRSYDPDSASTLVVFGASYCDNGHARDKRYSSSLTGYPYDSGRHTNGRVWAEYLASEINAHLYDYAYSGATVGESGSVPDTSQQIKEYMSDITSGNIKIRPGRVFHVIWVGINSVNRIWQHGGGDAAIQTEVNMVHQQMSDLVDHSSLHNIQAEYIVMTLPPLELVPNSVQLASHAADPSASLARIKSLTYAYNEGLRALNINRIHVLDMVPLWLSVGNNPGMYGFSQTRTACYKGGHVCDNPDAYLYWDSLHPTTKMHHLIADKIHEFLERLT